MAAQTVLPRWRGFNLLEMFTTKSPGVFLEDDFRWISDWGFNFVRLPMCYLLWIKDNDVYQLNDEVLANIDRAVELGRKYNVHVNLNFHRGPGYSVNREREEPFNLWKDAEALEAFCFHWEHFARRYKGVPNSEVSFNLINEPTNPNEKMSREDHERVMRAAVARIRAIDPDRLIILDGLSWGNDPCPELADLGVAQSTRAYVPMQISHYKAGWVQSSGWEEPSWPIKLPDGSVYDRARLAEHYGHWGDLAAKGVGVHCGEGGAFCHTPHAVYLAWLQDVLEILTSLNIGLALWNFRGSFGILDSQRADVAYEDWQGHLLDRKALELLQRF